MVWCALSSIGIFGPVFINGIVTSLHLSLLNDKFAPFLMGYGIPMNSAWSYQDDARLHSSNVVCHFLRVIFEERVLLNWGHALCEEGFSWPQTSLDLKLCDYFLWGYLKGRLFQKKSTQFWN
jgi:hypothetical protein